MEDVTGDPRNISDATWLAWYEADEGLMSMAIDRHLDAEFLSARVTVLCDPRLSRKAIVRDLVRIARALEECPDFYVTEAQFEDMCVLEA